MAKRQPVEDCDVLKFKLQALHDYISHHERKLDQFGIDVRKAVLFGDPHDLDDFVGRVQNIVSDLYTADPPKSLIAADLAAARAEVNAVYNASPEWTKIKAEVIESGLAEGPIEAGFDAVLVYALLFVSERLEQFRATGATAEDRPEPVGELLEAMEYARVVLDGALDPARHLRQRWIDALNGRPAKSSLGPSHRKRRGRPKDETVDHRNKKMFEAWETGMHPSYTSLGDAFNVSADVARKAVRSIRQKNKGNTGGREKGVK